MADGGGIGDLFDLSFTKFITPTVIRVVYVLVIVFFALLWLAAIIAAIGQNVASVIAALILGGLFFLIMLLIYRVILEITIVIFRIKENTDVLAAGKGGGSGDMAS